ncbi:hypothetical protein [Candidatus Neptunochlamydia vexilliferae]|nr:hypothetical protein [Candidatus Neptunochlamydia vexilliferae]
MEDEFDRIMGFFDLSSEEKEARLKEVFEDSVEYFKRFKYQMLNGTEEEKKESLKKMTLLKAKMEEETQRICKKTGMTPEQLAAYSSDPKNFSQEQWGAIKGAKQKLDEDAKEMKKKGDGGNEPPKKRRKRPKKWIQS